MLDSKGEIVDVAGPETVLRSRKRKLEAFATSPPEQTQKLLKMDERNALELDLVSPFCNYEDLCERLLPFHVFLTNFTDLPCAGNSSVSWLTSQCLLTLFVLSLSVLLL